MITVTQSISKDYATTQKIWEWLNSPRLPNFDDFHTCETSQEEIENLGQHLEKCLTFGAIVSGNLVGLICFQPTNSVSGWFQGMVMAPEIRCMGLGKIFLSKVVENLRNTGFKTMTAAIFVDNSHMQHVFKRCGAMKTGYIPQTTIRDGKLIGHKLYSFTDETVIITREKV